MEGIVYSRRWRLNNRKEAEFFVVFLSRPRRFGKSLLTSTLDSYFRGEKELFEGLKIMPLEKEWNQYPVIRLDLSTAKGQETAADLRARLMHILGDYARQYGKDPAETTPGALLEGIIKRASKQTGCQVVVLIDEYDAPLLEVLHETETILDAECLCPHPGKMCWWQDGYGGLDARHDLCL